MSNLVLFILLFHCFSKVYLVPWDRVQYKITVKFMTINKKWWWYDFFSKQFFCNYDIRTLYVTKSHQWCSTIKYPFSENCNYFTNSTNFMTNKKKLWWYEFLSKQFFRNYDIRTLYVTKSHHWCSTIKYPFSTNCNYFTFFF